MAKRAGQRVAGPVAAALGQRLPAGGQHHLARVNETAGGVERELPGFMRQRVHTAVVEPLDTELCAGREQCLEHVA